MQSRSCSDDPCVPLSYAKRVAVRSAVRELLVRVFAALGVATGLLWAVERPPPAPAKACEGQRAETIGSCFAETLVSTLLPYLMAMAIGLAVGVIIGALISVLMTGRGRPRRSESPAHTSRPGADDIGGRWIIARYSGRCSSCGSTITAGDRVHHRPRRTICAGCG